MPRVTAVPPLEMTHPSNATEAPSASGRAASTRVAVYTDHLFWRRDGELYSDRSFPGFVARMAPMLGDLVFLARVDPTPGEAQHRLPPDTEVVELPWVETLSSPLDVVRMMAGSVRRFWRVLDRVDAVWLVGSYLVSFVFAALAAMRGKRVVLGVRQDLPQYARGRYPGRRWIHLVADALEGVFRLLARVFPIAVVGPGLARNFRGARSLLELSVSLVGESDIVSREEALARSYDGELTILSVGRLDPEKNPLLLADVLAKLNDGSERWRLVVCGDGPLEEELAKRLSELGISEQAELRGYVALEDGLLPLYRESNVFLHVSWTEGLPQVLFEGFASGLPIVATAVGGVPDGVGAAGLLIPPGDPDAAVAALRRVASERELREQLVERGLERARAHTIESECGRLAAFIAGDPPG
jgi:glycosyltransferase involved in cell wall biosynthesis